jgi:hypothetical protein
VPFHSARYIHFRRDIISISIEQNPPGFATHEVSTHLVGAKSEGSHDSNTIDDEGWDVRYRPRLGPIENMWNEFDPSARTQTLRVIDASGCITASLPDSDTAYCDGPSKCTATHFVNAD